MSLGFISRWALAIVLNTIVLLLARFLIPGFTLTGTWIQILTIALVLTFLNFLVKPILRFFLAPLIILTLGIGLILINMLIFYLLDIYFANLSIQGIPAYFYAAVLAGVFNLAFHFIIKKS